MNKWTFAFILFALAALANIINIVSILSKTACEARWIDSGLTVKHSAFGGCRIQLKDGRWIPAANYREQ